MTGKPTCSATASAVSASVRMPSLPGTTGTPTWTAVWIAFDLLPIRLIASPVGPMKFSP